MKNKNYKEFFSDLPKDSEIFVNKSVEISDRIEDLLIRKKLSQRQFASLMDKKESEISKWLSGTHNFTLKTLARIEAILNENIIEVRSRIDLTVDYDFELFIKNNIEEYLIVNQEHIISRNVVETKQKDPFTGNIHELVLTGLTDDLDSKFCLLKTGS